MAKYTTEELLEAFKEMTLVELTEFKKAFEDAKAMNKAIMDKKPEEEKKEE